MLEGRVSHGIHINQESCRVDAVGGWAVNLAGEVQLHSVGEVSAVRELQTQDGVARVSNGLEHGRVCLRSSVRLNVRKFRTEEFLRSLDG